MKLPLVVSIGLLILIGISAVDVFSVRSKNAALWKTVETQKLELENKIKLIENEKKLQDSHYAKQLKDAEQRVIDANSRADKAQEKEDELEDKIRNMKDDHIKAMEELKTSFEKKIQDLKEDFEKQKSKLKDAQQSQSPIVQSLTNIPQSSGQEKPRADDSVQRKKKTYMCSKCHGNGEIKVKKRCEHCGGTGRIKEVRTRYVSGWYDGVWYSRGREKNSTIYHDCPHCLPGPMSGGGSKGYVFETETCTKCNGTGKIELN